jgi:hypothetical protein
MGANERQLRRLISFKLGGDTGDDLIQHNLSLG